MPFFTANHKSICETVIDKLFLLLNNETSQVIRFGSNKSRLADQDREVGIALLALGQCFIPYSSSFSPLASSSSLSLTVHAKLTIPLKGNSFLLWSGLTKDEFIVLSALQLSTSIFPTVVHERNEFLILILILKLSTKEEVLHPSSI